MHVLIRHKTKDFSAWKTAYDAGLDALIDAGLIENHIFTNRNDSSEVFILFEVTDPECAREFLESPDLRERMEAAGVPGKTEIFFLDDHSGLAVMNEIEELKRLEEVSSGSGSEPESVEFMFDGPDANKVFLAGSFNDWSTGSLPMKKNVRGQWTARVRLMPGRYEYKYFADGIWVIDKYCTNVVSGKDGENCAIDVLPKRAA